MQRKPPSDGLGITAEQAAGARWNIGGEPDVNLNAFETARDCW